MNKNYQNKLENNTLYGAEAVAQTSTGEYRHAVIVGDAITNESRDASVRLKEESGKGAKLQNSQRGEWNIPGLRDHDIHPYLKADKNIIWFGGANDDDNPYQTQEAFTTVKGVPLSYIWEVAIPEAINSALHGISSKKDWAYPDIHQKDDVKKLAEGLKTGGLNALVKYFAGGGKTLTNLLAIKEWSDSVDRNLDVLIRTYTPKILQEWKDEVESWANFEDFEVLFLKDLKSNGTLHIPEQKKKVRIYLVSDQMADYGF